MPLPSIMTMTDGFYKCCYITRKGNSCGQPAHFWIGRSDYDATHACEIHVDAMITGEDGELVVRLGNRTIYKQKKKVTR